MAEQTNDRVADWNDQSGERWVTHQARLDAMLAVFGQAAIEAAAPAMGERVLDVGCGAGESSLALASLVGAQGQVLGVDISEPLIDRARALAPQDMSVVFRVADASGAELPDGAFDILFSRFGVMFFNDPTGAFAHMRRALKPAGGSLLSAGAAWRRTTGCVFRLAQSKASSRRHRRPLPKRPARSRLATRGVWRVF